jgi:hypothetical protein
MLEDFPSTHRKDSYKEASFLNLYEYYLSEKELEVKVTSLSPISYCTEERHTSYLFQILLQLTAPVLSTS